MSSCGRSDIPERASRARVQEAQQEIEREVSRALVLDSLRLSGAAAFREMLGGWNCSRNSAW